MVLRLSWCRRLVIYLGQRARYVGWVFICPELFMLYCFVLSFASEGVNRVLNSLPQGKPLWGILRGVRAIQAEGEYKVLTAAE